MTRIMYLRSNPKKTDYRGFPVSCVAIELHEDYIEYNTSTHCPSDKYDRKVARSLAKERLSGHPKRLDGKFPTIHDVAKAIVSSIAEDKSEPARARKAARLWLKETS